MPCLPAMAGLQANGPAGGSAEQGRSALHCSSSLELLIALCCSKEHRKPALLGVLCSVSARRAQSDQGTGLWAAFWSIRLLL